jgi:pyrroloquinoline quinone (PQQ) biosynthesis protein C
MNGTISKLQDPVLELATSLRDHPAINNRFYLNWTSRALTKGQLQVFVLNYGAFVESFPQTLALLIAATSDVTAQVELSKTLYSEMGYGNSDKAHSKLFYCFFAQLADKMSCPGAFNRSTLLASAKYLPTTIAFIEGEKKLYTDPNPAVSMGAQLALEWQAYTMLRKLYEGARRYMSLWADEDEFHEACEYFYAHIGAAEKDHKTESLNAARQLVDSSESLDALRRGFSSHLTLFEDFWSGLAAAMEL